MTTLVEVNIIIISFLRHLHSGVLMKKRKLHLDVVWFIILFCFWLLLSGNYDFFHVSMGIFSSGLVVLIHRRLFAYHFFSDQVSLRPMRRLFFFFVYIPWLIYQIILAALTVARAVLSFKKHIDPALIRFTTNLPNNTSKVILANSITLTPGTITVLLEEDEFLVHGLMPSSYSSLVDGSFQSMIARIYDSRSQQTLQHIEVIKKKESF